ncbi:hypothetical protein K5V21_09075 [Clostridium sardiniense]|uniref:Uncharacterized protein n=1 Tax=Clostridium sardiniense TaxID=29369 RepID=A0ABS7KXR6_CLOSR|nr:hypothetical protein [Clostridium sardiniense]MBM7835202.1 putative membrane protein SirB2 [Clostridium sardiniense]MBY0755611.1 hypothetical protein [Clostridium sardiniense]
MNHILNVLAIAVCFYVFDLLWRHSNLYKKLTLNKVLNNKSTKIILSIISILLIGVCIIVEKIFSGYLFGEDNIKILIKGISLLILYITTSFIFMDKYIETSNTK